ncbi:MAG: hypothetical protein ACRERE_40670 [Candidatus Entotheonellia bacterium]
MTGGRLRGFKLTPKVWRIRREDFQAFGRVKHGDVPPCGGGMTYDPDQL